MKDQNSITVEETPREKYNRGLDIFIESVQKPDSALRACAHNQKCFNELMDKVVQLLQFAELKHVVYKLGQHFTQEGFTDEYGVGATFPQVTFNGEKIGGCSDTIKFLREQKHLEV